MLSLHKSLIFAFPDKNMFIWMYIFSYYILYVNNNNAYIYLKIVHSQIGSGGGLVIYFRFLFSASFSSQLRYPAFFPSQIYCGLFLPQLKVYFI